MSDKIQIRNKFFNKVINKIDDLNTHLDILNKVDDKLIKQSGGANIVDFYNALNKKAVVTSGTPKINVVGNDQLNNKISEMRKHINNLQNKLDSLIQKINNEKASIDLSTIKPVEYDINNAEWLQPLNKLHEELSQQLSTDEIQQIMNAAGNKQQLDNILQSKNISEADRNAIDNFAKEVAATKIQALQRGVAAREKMNANKLQ